MHYLIHKLFEGGGGGALPGKKVEQLTMYSILLRHNINKNGVIITTLTRVFIPLRVSKRNTQLAPVTGRFKYSGKTLTTYASIISLPIFTTSSSVVLQSHFAVH